ncbi:type I-C CRISPR-associated protein Cas5c [Frankia sp. AiPs1]|uniref:type I-C CRISPR-associated protein Cas5c n=1 Tax=Frankia sp. AiPs1 TaxID=573493 RepID=UPI00255A7998
MVARSSSADPPVVVQVWAEGGLFTRPELRVERVTYPVLTPTAAVGILESIFWKPEFHWVPVKIEVLKPINQFTLRRNETHDLPSLADAAGGLRRVDTVGHRDQRNAVCLKEVAYRIHAQVELAAHATKPTAAYRDQFRRRVARGSCFQQPSMGTREFPAYFGPPDETPPIDVTEDLGRMLLRIHHGSPPVSEFFDARLASGVVHIPRAGVRDGSATVVA